MRFIKFVRFQIWLGGVLCFVFNNLNAQILISGTSFDPLVPSDTSRAYWSTNDIITYGVQGGTITLTPPLAPTVNTNVFHNTLYYAITNNPYKLDKTRYKYLSGTALDNQLVVSPKTSSSAPNILTYKVLGLQPASTVQVKVTYCNVVQTTCTNDNALGLKGVVNPDQYNTNNGFDGPQVQPQNCTVATFTQTTANSQPIGADGNMTFYLNLPQTSDCKVVGIKSIEIYGTPKPIVLVSEGAEVCAKEQITLQTTILYNASYQWQVSTNGTTWTNLGTNPAQAYFPSTNATYYFRVSITSSGNTYTSDAVTVKAITCCTENGVPTSRKTVYYDDFGIVDLSDKTGSTYKVWDYSDELNPKQVTKTTSTPFRWPLPSVPTGAIFKATGPLSDGEYSVAGYLTGYNAYNGYNGAKLEWASRVTGPKTPIDPSFDHSGQLEGAALFLNFPANTGGQTFYTREIDNLCQKQLFFEAWIAVFTNSAAGSYNPVNVKVKLTEKGNATNTVEATATATREEDGGGQWVKLSATITLPATSSGTIIMDLINNQNVSVNGNDLVLDDIKIMACAPPGIDSYFDLPTLAKNTTVCKPNSITLYANPSQLVKDYYGSTLKYMFQWTKTPTDYTSWKNVGNPDALPSTSESYTIVNTSTDEAFTGLVDGDKVYFRVIAANDALFSAKNYFQGSLANYANINNPCKNYSVSEAIEATLACPLPVSFFNFKNEKLSNANHLTWSTIAEKNISFYVLEKSVNGVDFEVIYLTNAKNLGVQKSDYSFIDSEIMETEKVYYRVKQVDFDGKVNYSKVIFVHIDNSGLQIYPNPSNSILNVVFKNEVLVNKAYISDIKGIKVKEIDLMKEHQIQVSDLPKGIYLLYIETESEKYTHKIIVE